MHHLVDYPFDMEFEGTEFSDDSYAIVGRALAYSQKFEGDCRALRLLLEAKSQTLLGPAFFDDEDSFRQFVNKLHQAGLAEQIRQVSQRLHLPHDVEETLQLARTCRNEIAHEICLGIQFDIETDDGRRRLIDDVAPHIRRIAEAHLLVLAIVSLLTHEDLPAKHYLDAYCDRVIEWVCRTEAE